MNKNTYGDSLAAIRLTELIDEHPNSKIISRKVGRILEAFNRRVNAIELFHDRGDIEYLYRMLIEDIEFNCLHFLSSNRSMTETNESAKLTHLEMKIRTFLLNVIKGRFKAWKHGERDNIYRREEIGDAIVMRGVGGISLVTIHTMGAERFKKRAKK